MKLPSYSLRAALRRIVLEVKADSIADHHTNFPKLASKDLRLLIAKLVPCRYTNIEPQHDIHCLLTTNQLPVMHRHSKVDREKLNDSENYRL